MPTVENQQSYFTSRYFYMQATYLFCIIQEAPIFKEKMESLDIGTIQDFIILLTFVLIKANIFHDDYHEIFTNLSEYTVATLYLLKIVEKNVKK